MSLGEKLTSVYNITPNDDASSRASIYGREFALATVTERGFAIGSTSPAECVVQRNHRGDPGVDEGFG